MRVDCLMVQEDFNGDGTHDANETDPRRPDTDDDGLWTEWDGKQLR